LSGQAVTVDVHALRRRAAGLATLVEVSGALAATLELDRVLQTTTDGVCRLAGFDTAAAYLLEGETLRLGATTPALPPEFPEPLRLARVADHPHIWRCLERGAPVFVADFAADRGFELSIIHSGALAEAKKLLEELRDIPGILADQILPLGPALAAHVGRGMLAVCARRQPLPQA
jgi:transcriptional regulator with GAF, ATPase, and Fis domain